MRKFIGLVLCLMLLTSTACASIEYSLPEKWQRQVDFGNGIKGTITISAEGEAEWVSLLAPVSDVPLEVRAIHSDDRFQYRIYVEQGETQVGLTQLYGDENAVYLNSALADDILMLKTGGDLLNSLAGESGTNPDLYSAMLNILNVPQTSWDSKWAPALEKYESAIELWLQDYASAPSVIRGEDGATVLVRYDVPADMLKKQMVALWEMVLQDEVLLPLLKAQMTDEQQAAYLNPNLMYYYEQVLSALPMTAPVILEREMTAKGDILRTNMQFPLAMSGWTGLTVAQADDITDVQLTGVEQTVMLRLHKTSATPDSSSYSGFVRMIPADGAQGLAVAFTLVEIRSSSTDEDTRSHEVTTWNLSLAPDAQAGEGDWKSFDPVDVSAKVHFHSKSQQYNAVSLEVELALAWQNASFSAMIDLTTRSPWVLDELPTEGAVDASALTTEEITQRLIDMGLNGLTMLMMQQADEATATDLVAPENQ